MRLHNPHKFFGSLKSLHSPKKVVKLRASTVLKYSLMYKKYSFGKTENIHLKPFSVYAHLNNWLFSYINT